MVEFLMPSLGADMEAGTLVEWLVSPGDQIARGQVVAVVETEKGAIEIESFQVGAVERLLVEPGTKVPVGTPLALLRDTGAPVAAPAPAKQAPPGAPLPPPPAVAAPKAAAPAPIPKREAPAAPVAAVAPARASPAARKRAAELGVSLLGLAGSGPDGAVTVADVERAAAPRPGLAPMRAAIAAAMSRSKREIPHYYLATNIDLSRVLVWLATENERRPVAERLIPAVVLLKAVARTLRRFPELNGHFTDGAFRPSEAVHLGIAIALRQGGLVAPALHEADTLEIGEFMARFRDLVGRARAGGLRSSELSDSTVTVTNLGDQGVETVLPVIFPPQVAMIGFGAIGERPWAIDGALAVRRVVTASLAADHRVSDGHRGALFLQALGQSLQEPEAP
jgi:pyruvate dehydrogenase E2 component (dihydrolipoamide acetyltransferase)